MMSSENIPPVADTNNNNNNNSPIARKSTAPKSQEQPSLKCPRCDSSNTKFCYYNNYSLTQPRHFCKTCRRYWTKGGALRNVPIGGGCRKTKKHKPSSSSSTSSRFDLSAGPGNFLAPPTVTPAMEFQLGGLSLPRLHPATAGVYTQFIASSGSHHQPIAIGMGSGTAGTGCFSLDLLGLSNNYPTLPSSGNSSSSSSSSLSLAGGAVGAGDHTISISSIESLSSINQEMHWKLQQQRLAFIYGPTSIEDDHQENNRLGREMSLFKNLESTRKLDVAGPTPTEWLFEQIQSNNASGNYGATENNNNTTSCNNHHEDFNGIWTTELHHHHQQQQQQHHQFNGLQ